ncbi:hypothetical protein [Fusobacterium sp. FSA-380-WT-2B]|uniref:hypothetical protein n=1 Tax=Fusobacterium sp. FSA-380-WT-2B TaxID=2605786 RepID=UPI0012B3E5ED|nr:hypothetical protein [Fusobacterium sp. FSA-380-WT-2B]MSS61443.1 hypothetical protein [Fusobacterium sp. FSA-380-WT-2B]
MLFKEWLEENGYEEKVTLEELIKKGKVHIEKKEIEMKVWFLEDFSLDEIIDILEERISSNYKMWDYIEDKEIWIYRY